jgi:CCR4-NOT transcription complex subunit 1
VNAIVNQLRFPSEHTKFFANFVLEEFAETASDYLRELILSLLVERLVICEPYPWGVCVTFVELMQNAKYKVAHQSFVKGQSDTY